MKRRILCIALALFMLCPMLSMLSCGSSKRPAEGTVTRMTVDINPSLEFIVDDQNKVVAVTALNDDGSLLIAGEAFIGLTPEEAVELTVSLATETGYLVKGSVEADSNTVKISVSGDTSYAKALLKDVQKKAEDALEKCDIKGKIETVEALKTDALRELALSTSIYTEEELAAMTDEQLYKVIAAGRIETALLITEDMRKAYFAAKEYEISFAESEATAAVIDAMGGIYTVTYNLYKAALDSLNKAIKDIDDFRYNSLVSPESEYQKSLEALRNAKSELLKQRTYTASLNINGTEYALASVTLQLKEEQYNAALAAYEALGEKLNNSLKALIDALDKAQKALASLEDNFSDDIKAELQAKALEIETNINSAKDSFFNDFETAHKDDINAIEASLKTRKQELIASINNSGN